MIYRRISGLHPEMERMPHATIKNYRTIDNFFLKDQGNLPIGLNYTEDDRIKI